MHLKAVSTNGNTNHPADVWAGITTDRIMEIFQVEPDADPSIKLAKDSFEKDVLEILTRKHQEIHDREQKFLETEHLHRLKKSIDPCDHFPDVLENTMEDIVTASKIHPIFFNHFNHPKIREHVIMDMLRVDFASSMDINRQYFLQKHKDLLKELN